MAEQPMSGVQKDKLQKLRDEKKTSIPQATKDGKIDSSLLDPEEFDKFDAEYRAYGAETQRIRDIIKEFLDDHYPGSKEEPYTWDCGFFLEKDPRSQGAKGWKVLQVEMLGPWWSVQLQHEAGLSNHEGAVTWNGRGTYERHIICVKTQQLQRRQQAAKTARLQEQTKQQVQSVAGEKSEMTITETQKKMPVIQIEGPPPKGDASATE